MKIEDRYPKDHAIHRTLLPNADDPVNSDLYCGFCYRRATGEAEHKHVLFRMSHYAGLYIVKGSGVYKDAETGKEYPITPGCVVQRMPGKSHYTSIKAGADWLEFYFSASAKVFDMLVSMKLVTDAPVFYVGESPIIIDKILDYMDLFERTDDYHATELLLEFQKWLCYLNSYQPTAQQNEQMERVAKKLKQNNRLGIPLRQIALECGIGYENLRKQFRNTFGCSMEQYRIRCRISEAKNMLLNKELSLKEIAAELGYCDTYAFCKQFKQQAGISPGKFVENWKG